MTYREAPQVPRLFDECPFEPRLVTFLLKKEGIPSSRFKPDNTGVLHGGLRRDE